ncbi:hypothetical protein BGZ70_001185, partial [Mortierella alpina]
MRITSAVLLSAAAAVACAMHEHKPESERSQLYARNRFADRNLAGTLGGLLSGSHESATSEVQDTPSTPSTSAYVKRDDNLLGDLPVVGGVGDLLKRRGGLLGGLLEGSDNSDTSTEVQDTPSTSAYVKRDDNLLANLPVVGGVGDLLKRGGGLLGGLLGGIDNSDTSTEVQDTPSTSAYVKRDDNLLANLPVVGGVGDLLKRG